MRKPADAGQGSSTHGDRPFSVTELAARIDSALKSGLPARVKLVGEISGLRIRTHSYFTIKDEGAAIGAVVFASTAKRLAALPEDGARVLATGRVEYYGPSGKVSLIVDRLEPIGQGPLEQRFRRLASELRESGWFDPAGKKPLPVFPQRIAVVTSKSSAALQDVLDTARRRAPWVEWLIVDARVQGTSAAGEVARAVRELSAHHARLGIDAILITRGGGSLEDLWAFNERVVAEAVWESAIPVVAAIGHETDTTIAELVADERAATPTQAVMRLTPDRGALLEQLDAITRRLRDSMRGRLRYERERSRRFAEHPRLRDPSALIRPHRERAERLGEAIASQSRQRILHERSRLERLSARLERLRPASQHARREERLRATEARLHRVMQRRLDRRGLDQRADMLHHQVHSLLRDRKLDLLAITRELEAVSPMRVLARGYSVTLDASGKAIRDAASVQPGQRVATRVASGQFASEVVGDGSDSSVAKPAAEPKPKKPAPKPGLPKRRPRSVPGEPDQMDLFGSGG